MLYFVRHCATDWNDHLNAKGEKDPMCQGKVDILLNEHGIEQARYMANQIHDIKFDRVICSPLGRARQTCDLIYHGSVHVEIRSEIEERDFGEYEGMLRSEFDFYGFWNNKSEQKFQKAESLEHLIKRVFTFLDELKEYQAKNPNANILVVGHGGVGVVLMSYFKGIPANGDYLSFEMPHGKPLVLDFNDVLY